MQHYASLDQVDIREPTVLTIGKFNGMHLGHRYLLEQVVARAREIQGVSAAITFEPHPTLVLQPEHQRVYLAPESVRLQQIDATGIDYLITLRFDHALARWTAGQFMRHICEHINLRELWVGPNFRLGYRRHGTVEVLREIGAQLGFEVHPVAPLEVDGTPVSATRIRELLQAGRVADIPALLGRAFTLEGRVVYGDQRGRTIGVPTANLEVGPHHLLPSDGVYAGQVMSPDGAKHPAVTNVGVRPTVGTLKRTVEAHLLDWNGDLYGQVLQVTLLHRIRSEQKFDSLAALQAQIQQDIVRARELVRQPA